MRVSQAALRHAQALLQLQALGVDAQILQAIPRPPYQAHLAALAVARVEQLIARGTAVGAALDLVGAEFNLAPATLKRWRLASLSQKSPRECE